jgi:hypothetical protein
MRAAEKALQAGIARISTNEKLDARQKMTGMFSTPHLGIAVDEKATIRVYGALGQSSTTKHPCGALSFGHFGFLILHINGIRRTYRSRLPARTESGSFFRVLKLVMNKVPPTFRLITR